MNQEKSMFWLQMKAMLIRNCLLKVRKKNIITEVVFPLYALGFLMLIKTAIHIPSFPEVIHLNGGVNLIKYFNSLMEDRTFSVAVAPNSSDVQRFLEEINATWDKVKGKNSINFVLFASEELITQACWRKPQSFNLGLVFHSGNPFDGNLEYEILTNPSWVKCPDVDQLYADPYACRKLPDADTSGVQIPCPARSYLKSGLVPLQLLVDVTKIRVSCPEKELVVPSVNLNILPKDAYTTDWLQAIRPFIPLYLVIAMSQFINFLLILIVGEKENRIKDGMKIMGLRISVYWLSWFTVYFGLVFFTSLASTFMLHYLQVLQNSSYTIVFALILLFSVSIIIASFMMTPFFNKSKTAAIVGSFVVFLTSLLYFIKLPFTDPHPVVLYISSLLSPAAFSLAMDEVLKLDLSGKGLTTETLWSTPGFSVGDGLIMIIVDIVLYSLLTFYLDSVWPSEFGTKQQPLFCLPFFRNLFKQPSLAHYSMESEDNDNTPLEEEEVSEEQNKHEAIRIVGLKRTFFVCNAPPTNTLKGFNLCIYENEITAILGQNGAGKSTLFNILTGLLSPTSGTAFIYNRDIRDPKSMAEIQSMTGVCPQEDLLFDQLTAREHLSLFARIKGAPLSSVERVLQDVDLEDKSDCYTKTFSGGQKRKLSVGIALIGDPKIIILDEPTAGVDAYSKRRMWSLLQRIKSDKVVLLSTHLMEEADMVADRKAIICNGKLRCYGTSLFLKNRFGIGFQLNIAMEDPGCSELVTQIINSYVPDARMSRIFGREMHFTFPKDSEENFISLLYLIEKDIKSHDKKLKILSYTVSMPSLEQIFLQLTNESENCKEDESVAENTANSSSNSNCILGGSVKKNVPGESFLIMDIAYKPNRVQMLLAMLHLRFLQNVASNPHHFCLMIILPLIFSACGFYVNKVNYNTESDHVLHLKPQIYGNTTALAVHGLSISWLSNVNSSLMPKDYDGNYPSLLNIKPLLGALNTKWTSQAPSVDIFFNDTMQHSLPIIINAISNAIFRTWNHQVDNISDPLSISVQQLPSSLDSQMLNFALVVSSMLVGTSFSMLPVNLVTDIANDRKINTKHLLHVSGLPRFVYFSAHVIMFGGTLLFISLLVLILLFWFKTTANHDATTFITIGLILTTYSPAAILFYTCVSYIFNKVQTIRTVLPTTVMWMGSISFLIMVILDALTSTGLFVHVAMSLTNVIYVPYATFFFIERVRINCVRDPFCSQPSFSDYFTTEVVSLMLGCLIQIPLWSFVLLAVDLHKSGKKIFQLNLFSYGKLKETHPKINVIAKYDNMPAVEEKQENVLQLIPDGEVSNHVVKVQNLTKEYTTSKKCFSTSNKDDMEQSKRAVANVSFAVNSGEVLGLLGHNGAGKTTTIKIITGQERPTLGCVWIKGSSDNKTEGNLGYCPQVDALWENVTVREHLKLYASIRGVPPEHYDRVVDAYLTGLRLTDHKDKRVEHCSGGTRRKLSFAIAMLGGSKLILLDEPSTGMDTLSKRFMWDTIKSSFEGSRGAILSTHLMQEAEALCSRIGIMTNGRLWCIGTTQYLKTHYGGSYSLELRLSLTANSYEVQQAVLSRFRDSTVKETTKNTLLFSIPQESLPSIADVFSFLEQNKSELGILIYCFNHTNLEQVFLNVVDMSTNHPSDSQEHIS